MIMVTGGAGFIGSHIVRELVNEGEDLLIYDKSLDEDRKQIIELRLSDIVDRITMASGDICNYSELVNTAKKYGISQVVHAAAAAFIPEAAKEPRKTIQINVEGTLNVLEMSRKSNVDRFLFVSSASVYGEAEYSPIDETHPLNPVDVYGVSKLAGEKLTLMYSKTHGLKTTIVRPTSVYGPGELYGRVLKLFIENALTGKELQVHGGGEQERDFTYVSDTARGIVLALLSDKAIGEAFNISAGNAHPIKETIEIIREFIPNVKVKITPSRQACVPKRYLDITKARKLLRYEPKYDLKAGIREYVKWIAEKYAPRVGLQIKNEPLI